MMGLQNKEYQAAINLFETYKNTEASDINPNVYLYEGASLVQLNKYTEAQTSFSAFIALNTIDQPKGYWFMGLSQLKSGDKEEAINSFEAVVKINDYKKAEASALLEELKEE